MALDELKSLMVSLLKHFISTNCLSWNIVILIAPGATVHHASYNIKLKWQFQYHIFFLYGSGLHLSYKFKTILFRNNTSNCKMRGKKLWIWSAQVELQFFEINCYVAPVLNARTDWNQKSCNVSVTFEAIEAIENARAIFWHVSFAGDRFNITLDDDFQLNISYLHKWNRFLRFVLFWNYFNFSAKFQQYWNAGGSDKMKGMNGWTNAWKKRVNKI